MTLYRCTQDLIRADPTGRTIHGIAMPYGVTAQVDDGRGTYSERFEPGAFARSIAERGHKLRLFVQHETRKLPIGKATQLDDRTDGLHAAFAVARTRDGDEALELVGAGVVDGFSVGFSEVPRGTRRDADGTVVRVEAALREVSLVHSPAYADALVAGVRSLTPPLSVEIAQRRLDLILKAW